MDELDALNARLKSGDVPNEIKLKLEPGNGQGYNGSNAEAYNAYLKMLDDLEQAQKSGMTAREFAMSKGVPSSLTDEEAALLDEYNLKMFSEGAGDGLNKLPKTTEESVRTKLDTYLLEPNHPVGGSKAKWFKEALGFTKDNSIDLGKQIVFDPNKAVQTASNVHGTKFSQIIPVHGANGKVIDVEFIFIKNNYGVIRLVTSSPTKR